MGLNKAVSDPHSYAGYKLVTIGPDVAELEELTTDSTGGCQGMFFSEPSGELRELLFYRSVMEIVPEKRSAQPNLDDMLETISRTLGLNKSQLAEVCGLRTRKTLYAWVSGAVPRKKSMQRVHLLYRAALDWSRSGFVCPEKVLHVPILQGRTLYDLLKADPLDLEAVHFAGARLSMENESGANALIKDPFGA